MRAYTGSALHACVMIGTRSLSAADAEGKGLAVQADVCTLCHTHSRLHRGRGEHLQAKLFIQLMFHPLDHSEKVRSHKPLD